MIASFTTLYRRSSYTASLQATEEDLRQIDALVERRRADQAERYCVAAIGFCISYEPSFKRHLLSTLWEQGFHQKIPESCEAFTAQVEPRGWNLSADLIFIAERHVLVVEYKIDADLKDHQNPTKKCRFTDSEAAPKGYGVQLSRKKKQLSKDVYYVVVGKKVHEFKHCNVNGIPCAFIEWSSLIFSQHEPPMVSDLYDCLGWLGVTEMTFRNMNENEKLAADARSGAKAYQYLRRVCDEAGLKAHKIGDNDIGWAENEYSFGLAFSAKQDDRLSQLIRASGPQLGWIGYQKVKDEEGVSLDVLIYCDEKARSTIMRRLADKNPEEKDYGILVSCTASASPGDVKWFASVFDALRK